MAHNRLRMAAVVLSLFAPVGLYFVVRAAAIGASPSGAAAFPPFDASRVLRPIAVSSLDPRKRIPPAAVELARRGAVSGPLNFESFMIVAEAEDQQGRLKRAILLMEEARRRRPSFLPIRLQLIDYYQRARRVPELLAEVDFALRRSDEVRQILLPELVKLIAARDGRKALAEMFTRNPEWKDDFFKVASARPPAPQYALSLLNLSRHLRPTAGLTQERHLYLQSLVAAGEFKAAHEVALSLVPAAERNRQRLLFDGFFGARRGTEPFAWTTTETDAGRAEIVPLGSDGPHLEVNYFGGSDAKLIEQTLALQPGRFVFSFQVRSQTGNSAGDIFWVLTCLPSDQEIVRLSIGRPGSAYRTIQTMFTVPPAACAGQKLRLVGQPGDVSAAVNAQIARLEVVHEDR